MCFCMKMKNKMEGSSAKTMAVMAYCHCVLYWPTKVYAASVKVLVFGELLTISIGSRKSFQIHMTSRTMTVAVTGLSRGNMILT